VLSQVLGSAFFSSTTNLADKNNSLGFWVVKEDFQTVDEIGAIERIATNTNAESLT
jgi:hypothetical protein